MTSSTNVFGDCCFFSSSRGSGIGETGCSWIETTVKMCYSVTRVLRQHPDLMQLYRGVTSIRCAHVGRVN